MPTKTIADLTEMSAQPADADYFPVRDSSAVADRKVLATYFARTTDGLTVLFTGGGTGVTLAAAQSLSNKTLITPTIASFVNATPTHTNAAGGGTLATYATLTGSETLTNKTLTSPTINGATVSGTLTGGTYASSTLTTPTIADFTNATHDHSNDAGGGTLSTHYHDDAVPANKNSTGTKGEIRGDSDYVYFCYATNQWSRDNFDDDW